jgi:ribosome recycling factor
MDSAIKQKTTEKMEGAIDALKRELTTVRTGRASIGLVEHLSVDFYGTPTPLVQAASLSTPDARQIMIQPWDAKMIPTIEKAIMKSDLGLTPMSDGKCIRINIPQLTEDRRKEMVKLVRKRGEDTRVAVRNIRRDANDSLKKLQKDGHISEDDVKKSLDEVQKMTDRFVAKVDEVLAHKEKEIMEV